jgi:hypothetical protein
MINHTTTPTTMSILTTNTDRLRIAVAEHLAADAVIQGTYWKEDRGCFIGCLAHSANAEDVTQTYGIPLPLIRIAEHIFESLNAYEAREFFAAFPDAISHNGRDLSCVVWKFLAAELRTMPAQPADVQAVIDRVTAGLDLLATGQEWPKAADAADAAYAVSAAYAAAAAAAHAAYEAAYAAAAAAADEAAYAAAAAAAAAYTYTYAIRRQRDLLLSLIAP